MQIVGKVQHGRSSWRTKRFGGPLRHAALPLYPGGPLFHQITFRSVARAAGPFTSAIPLGPEGLFRQKSAPLPSDSLSPPLRTSRSARRSGEKTLAEPQSTRSSGQYKPLHVWLPSPIIFHVPPRHPPNQKSRMSPGNYLSTSMPMSYPSSAPMAAPSGPPMISPILAPIRAPFSAPRLG